MTEEEQIKYLGLDKLNVIDKINIVLNGEFQLTGSISLVEYGIVKRKIGDIDIVVKSLDRLKVVFDQKGYDFKEWFDYSEELENPKNTLQGKGKVTNRISFEIDGIKCCAFYGPLETFNVCTYMLNREFKVSHPRYSIEAKKKYVQRLFEKDHLNPFQVSSLSKHNSDIQLYYEKNILIGI